MSALSRAEASYGQLETLQAEFTQTIANPMLGEPEVTHGTLYLAPPNRFAMRFSQPEGDRIVADGTWLWAYTPSSVPNQVIKQPIPNQGAATPNLLSQFVINPLEHYRASYIGTDSLHGELLDIIALTPRRDDMPFRAAEIAVARSTGLLLRLTVRERSGQRRTLVFERVRTGLQIAESELSFAVPSGVRVVTP